MTDIPDQSFELSLEKIVAGGAGLARLDGRVFLVDGALPGSRVLARIPAGARPGPFAELVSVLEPSPDACEPPCPHFGDCGGCAWQHAAYPAQLAYKRDLVAEQLARLGGLDLSPADTLASPEPYGYRNKMEFAFGPGPALGLKSRRGPGRIVEVEGCLLMPPGAMDILRTLRELVRQSGLPSFSPRSGQGVWRHAVLRHSLAAGRFLLQLIVSGKTWPDTLRPLGQELLHHHPELAGVALGLRQDRSDFAIAQRQAWVLGQDHLVEEMAGLTFQVSAQSFFQTNTAGAARLVQAVLEAAGPVQDRTVWDLYCGVGSLGLPLARAGAMVEGFELSPGAVRDAKANAARNALEGRARFKVLDVLDALGKQRTTPDLVVLDPPRAGLHQDAPARLAASGAARLVYVSCDPATLARDLGRLSETFAVERVTPVDLFPQTPHVECVVALARR